MIVTQAYIDGIKEGRATLNETRSNPCFDPIVRQHSRSRGLAYGALADFVEFRRGEMEFWRNQVSRVALKAQIASAEKAQD